MFEQLPADRQFVEVRFDDRTWLSAIYRNGQFVDAYGLPLDDKRISSWRPVGANADKSVQRQAH